MKLYFSLALFLLLTLNAKSQSINPTISELDELFQRTFGYLAAAKSCRDKNSFEIASDSIVRIMNYAQFKGFTIRSISLFKNNPDEYVNKGVTKYEEQKWVSCSQVLLYVKNIDAVTRRFP